MKRLSGLSLDECIYACSGSWRTLGCRFVNYDIDCELALNDMEIVDDHFNIIGPMSALFPFEYRERTSSPQSRCVKSDFGIAGGEKFRVASLEECAATCKGRHENLLEPCYPGSSFIDAACWSPEAYVQPEKRCILNGKKFGMAALVHISAPSLEDCLESCTQQLDQGCRAVSFGGEICSLYHDDLRLVEAPDSKSAGEVERRFLCAEMRCWFAEIDLHPSPVAACVTPDVEVDERAFKSTHTPTFFYCARSCAANAKCAAFTFKEESTRCTFHRKTDVKPRLNAVVGNAECYRRLYPEDWPFLNPLEQGKMLTAAIVIGILVLCSALFAGAVLFIRERREAKKLRELEEEELAAYQAETQ
ncbi:MAG: uncharacterized protein KVP18_004869 [Porospora cf. gigantea A]|uniref:uncharacterized protein n=1 Tax=Porospora cf. gigantea A TaxID=2853593 RepID=UPI00355A5BB2|nr:MAG: hypothetical protein KVP18_004869 [Porospora cf. gigantea A]